MATVVGSLTASGSLGLMTPRAIGAAVGTELRQVLGPWREPTVQRHYGWNLLPMSGTNIMNCWNLAHVRNQHYEWLEPVVALWLSVRGQDPCAGDSISERAAEAGTVFVFCDRTAVTAVTTAGCHSHGRQCCDDHAPRVASPMVGQGQWHERSVV